MRSITVNVLLLLFLNGKNRTNVLKTNKIGWNWTLNRFTTIEKRRRAQIICLRLLNVLNTQPDWSCCMQACARCIRFQFSKMTTITITIIIITIITKTKTGASRVGRGGRSSIGDADARSQSESEAAALQVTQVSLHGNGRPIVRETGWRNIFRPTNTFKITNAKWNAVHGARIKMFGEHRAIVSPLKTFISCWRSVFSASHYELTLDLRGI